MLVGMTLAAAQNMPSGGAQSERSPAGAQRAAAAGPRHAARAPDSGSAAQEKRDVSAEQGAATAGPVHRGAGPAGVTVALCCNLFRHWRLMADAWAGHVLPGRPPKRLRKFALPGAEPPWSGPRPRGRGWGPFYFHLGLT